MMVFTERIALWVYGYAGIKLMGWGLLLQGLSDALIKSVSPDE
jgi:hypothetical protein